uniref:Alcohol dehydrogenase-like n=1 Tax=Diabrotica virgifera virgifera TaxID=50390 RepID=A0A6P7F715_DIAVI
MLTFPKLLVTSIHQFKEKIAFKLNSLYRQATTTVFASAKHTDSSASIKLKASLESAPSESGPLSKKVALVTGGSTPCGLICVQELLRCGAKGVMFTDTDENLGRKKLDELCQCFDPNRAAFIRSDLRDALLLRNAFLSSKKHFCSLDIIVNIIEQSEKYKWTEEIDRNLTGIVRSTLIGYELLSTQKGGKGGTICNLIVSPFEEENLSPVLVATRSYLMSFGQSMSSKFNKGTGVKIITGFADDDKKALKSAKGQAVASETLTTMLENAAPGSAWTLQFLKNNKK